MLCVFLTFLRRRNKKECSKVVCIEDAFWKSESDGSAITTLWSIDATKTVLLEIIIDI